MSSPFVRAAFLILITVLVSAAQSSSPTSAGDQDSHAGHDQSAPYIIEKQLKRCTTGPECSGKAGTTQNSGTPQPNPDPLKPEPVPGISPGPGSVRPPEKQHEPISNIPVKQHVPTGAVAEKAHNVVIEPSKHESEKSEPVPISKGPGPLLAIGIVGVGGLLGLAGSAVFLDYRFSKRMETRPNGDLSRLGLRAHAQVSQPWQTVDPTIFQFESALRRKLITRDEFRELRSKYLIAGNFTFSMLVPLLLGLAVLTTAAGKWYQWIAISAFGALVTAALTTYAMDQRHQFRSEYRTLVIQNLRQTAEPEARVGATPTAEYSSWAEDLVQTAIRLVLLATRSRPPATGPTGSKENE